MKKLLDKYVDIGAMLYLFKLQIIGLIIIGGSIFVFAAWDGATNFPGALDTDATVYDVEDDSTVEDEHHDALAQAVIAIETKVGTGADTPTATDVFVGTGAGTSGWNPLSAHTCYWDDPKIISLIVSTLKEWESLPPE